MCLLLTRRFLFLAHYFLAPPHGHLLLPFFFLFFFFFYFSPYFFAFTLMLLSSRSKFNIRLMFSFIVGISLHLKLKGFLLFVSKTSFEMGRASLCIRKPVVLAPTQDHRSTQFQCLSQMNWLWMVRLSS